jgi:trans-aconitate methyltransferase
VLSFGCSTGEEVMELSSIFPHAEIIGIDVVPHRIRVAKRRCQNGQLHFFLSQDPTWHEYAPFDLIVAKSVFVRHPEAKTLSNINSLMSFSDFEKVVLDLVAKLRSGGYLVIYNANFRMMDTAAMRLLTPIIADGLVQASEIPVFNKNGVRMDDVVVREIIFRKTYYNE